MARDSIRSNAKALSETARHYIVDQTDLLLLIVNDVCRDIVEESKQPVSMQISGRPIVRALSRG